MNTTTEDLSRKFFKFWREPYHFIFGVLISSIPRLRNALFCSCHRKENIQLSLIYDMRACAAWCSVTPGWPDCVTCYLAFIVKLWPRSWICLWHKVVCQPIRDLMWHVTCLLIEIACQPETVFRRAQGSHSTYHLVVASCRIWNSRHSVTPWRSDEWLWEHTVED